MGPIPISLSFPVVFLKFPKRGMDSVLAVPPSRGKWLSRNWRGQGERKGAPKALQSWDWTRTGDRLTHRSPFSAWNVLSERRQHIHIEEFTLKTELLPSLVVSLIHAMAAFFFFFFFLSHQKLEDKIRITGKGTIVC